MKSTQVQLIAAQPSQTGLIVTLEGTNLLLTVLLSTAALLGIGIKLVSKFNAITTELRNLREDLNAHANVEGHSKLLEQVRIIQKDLAALDKRFDIHLQDYTNYKDATLLALNGANEKINHTWVKTEKVLIEHKSDIKELQQFLQKHQSFKIRG